MSFIWSEYLQGNLLEYIEGYPSLWDRSNTNYNRADKNNKIWEDIGNRVGCTAEEAQHQFALLKRRYARHKEKMLKEARRGLTEPSPRGRRFYLAEKMSFLEPAKKRTRTVDSFSVPIPIPENDSPSSFLQPTSTTFPTPSQVRPPQPSSFCFPQTDNSAVAPSSFQQQTFDSQPSHNFSTPALPQPLRTPSPSRFALTPYCSSSTSSNAVSTSASSLLNSSSGRGNISSDIVPSLHPPDSPCLRVRSQSDLQSNPQSTSNTPQQISNPMPNPSIQPSSTQTSRDRQRMLEEGLAAFQAIKDAAIAISNRSSAVTAPNFIQNSGDIYQQKITDFISFAVSTLPEEKKKKFLEKMLEIYLDINKE